MANQKPPHQKPPHLTFAVRPPAAAGCRGYKFTCRQPPVMIAHCGTTCPRYSLNIGCLLWMASLSSPQLVNTVVYQATSVWAGPASTTTDSRVHACATAAADEWQATAVLQPLCGRCYRHVCGCGEGLDPLPHLARNLPNATADDNDSAPGAMPQASVVAVRALLPVADKLSGLG